MTRIPDAHATADVSATPPESTDDLVFGDAVAESEDVTPDE